MKESADQAPPTLKEQVLAELRDWSAECSDIAREILKAGGSEKETSSYERRADAVDGLIVRLKDAVLAERSPKLIAATIDVYADDLADLPSEPAYRYEASCNLPFDSTAVGAIVGYSDDSESGAAAELKEILADLSLDPAGVRLLDGGTGEEILAANP